MANADKLIYMGSDHTGVKDKVEIKSYLEADGYEVVDLGCFGEDPCDYPDIAREVAEKVAEVKGARGIILCGSGIGVAMTANKLKGVRAVMANDPYLAEQARLHNDANVLTMGARLNTFEEMKPIMDKFLTTDFESGEERRVRRVNKIDIF
ncbi:ribose 5-phosphate isomerase B [Candidatus Peregrinibacteria bacterium HGW-Peregrinibacteria-1]|jgi:ribose 5-phosphate isomerase B|nr:MAG: ribose 5-phosphate isomerase B [Candidatus Peregrinibacteria bacterium HGW-Peregrinibacteria-1]